MPKGLNGKANHVHEDGSMSTLDICTVEPEKNERLGAFITIGDSDGNESIIINSIEQWKQVDAIVRHAFDMASE